MKLEGKIALVTGAGKGIGREIALKLADLGADVCVNYNSSEVAAQEVVKAIEAKGGKAIAFQCDVSNYEATEAMVDQIEKKWGQIDILVNNAGITKDGLLMRMTESDWTKVMAANLNSVFNCSKIVSKRMMKKKYGKIVNIASVVGITGNAGQSNYAASKAGVIGFSKSMALELGSRNIHVNVVAPGFIETDMTQTLSDKTKEAILDRIPTKRFGQGSDVANVVGFLCSSEADYITGQVINVDGGMVMA